jgi:hypothetical protein
VLLGHKAAVHEHVCAARGALQRHDDVVAQRALAHARPEKEGSRIVEGAGEMHGAEGEGVEQRGTVGEGGRCVSRGERARQKAGIGGANEKIRLGCLSMRRHSNWAWAGE